MTTHQTKTKMKNHIVNIITAAIILALPPRAPCAESHPDAHTRAGAPTHLRPVCGGARRRIASQINMMTPHPGPHQHGVAARGNNPAVTGAQIQTALGALLTKLQAAHAALAATPSPSPSARKPQVKLL